jgi:hypothetical protein
MSLADEMRSATAAAESQRRVEELRVANEKLLKHQQLYDKLKADEDRYFVEEIRPKIKEAADRGNKAVHISYDKENDHSSTRMSIVREHAEKEGFTCSFDSERSNMGDSAAPCMVTSYWLEIRWAPDPDRRRRQW